MSAFLVSDYHINYLVSYAVLKDLHVRLNGQWLKAEQHVQEMFNVLYRANVESVNARYKEDEMVIPSQYKPTRVPFDPVQVLKACRCFDYQACEVDNYIGTEAAGIIRSIESRAINALPGYDKADWCLSEPRQTVKGGY